MENDKLFEFMEKMYSALTERLVKIESKQEESFKELREEVKKKSIKLEDLEKKVDIIAEVLQSHIKQNKNDMDTFL